MIHGRLCMIRFLGDDPTAVTHFTSFTNPAYAYCAAHSLLHTCLKQLIPNMQTNSPRSSQHTTLHLILAAKQPHHAIPSSETMIDASKLYHKAYTR